MPNPKKGTRQPGSGRKAGTPNKKTVELIQVLEKHNFDPGEQFIWLYKEAKKIFEFRKQRSNLVGALSALDRMIEINEDLAQYVFPKKKAVEHSGEVGVRTFADFIASADGDDDEDEE